MALLNKKTVDDISVKGKRVLCRCDFNVPLKDGVITDENRLTAALPTIKKLIADGGRVILCSHLGKPKGEPKPELSLAPVAARLTELLGQEVKFAADDEVVGPNAKAAAAASMPFCPPEFGTVTPLTFFMILPEQLTDICSARTPSTSPARAAA